MKKHLSIIIPVYNVENYLETCINSILKKNIDNYEIILIDDGSTDKSGAICDEYSKKYDEIKVYHQKNRGLSGARNTGIRHANGEFIMFIDSDDYISEHVDLKKIVDNLKSDITQYKWIYFYENRNKYVYFPDHHNYKGAVVDILKRKVQDGSISVSACDKIIRKKVLEKNKILFKEGILSEDLDWSLRLYLNIKTIEDINEDVYVYRQQRKGSITSKIKQKNIMDLYNIIHNWYNYEYEDKRYRDVYYNYLAYHYITLLCLINKKNCSKELKKRIYDMKELLDYTENNKVKLCQKLFKMVGKRGGILILKMYIYLKNKGIVKI